MVSVYVPNGRAPGSDHDRYKLAWLASLREWVAAGPEATIVCGDMNIRLPTTMYSIPRLMSARRT